MGLHFTFWWGLHTAYNYQHNAKRSTSQSKIYSPYYTRKYLNLFLQNSEIPEAEPNYGASLYILAGLHTALNFPCTKPHTMNFLQEMGVTLHNDEGSEARESKEISPGVDHGGVGVGLGAGSEDGSSPTKLGLSHYHQEQGDGSICVALVYGVL